MQYDPESEADRLLLIKMLLHASDIGSAARPLVINDTLSKRVHLEFAALAQREVQAGLPVTLAVNPQDPRMCAQVRAMRAMHKHPTQIASHTITHTHTRTHADTEKYRHAHVDAAVY